MRVELPQFKRCCFCIPLRHGILVWGYIKLLSALILYYPIVRNIIAIIQLYTYYGAQNQFLVGLVLSLLFLLALVMETTLCIILLIGAHNKNPRLLKSYYFYSIFVIVVSGILFILYAAYEIYALGRYLRNIMNWMALVPFITSGSLNIILQFYFILLVKSEIIKLNNNVNFRFENHATEAQCAMSVNCDDVNEAQHVGDAGDDQVKHVNDIETRIFYDERVL